MRRGEVGEKGYVMVEESGGGGSSGKRGERNWEGRARNWGSSEKRGRREKWKVVVRVEGRGEKELWEWQKELEGGHHETTQQYNGTGLFHWAIGSPWERRRWSNIVPAVEAEAPIDSPVEV